MPKSGNARAGTGCGVSSQTGLSIEIPSQEPRRLGISFLSHTKLFEHLSKHITYSVSLILLNTIAMGEESDSMIHLNTINTVEETPLAKALQGISFSCSGSLKVNPKWEENQGSFDFLLNPPSVPPVTIRWDDDGRIGKVQLPLQGHEIAKLDQLIKHGGPATFGHLGNDVLDESYRKATKLDSSQFSSNFHPHDHGILDAISQTLLPTVTELNPADKTRHTENWGLVAELYKLNIYSAPSGRFKAHVDTPRGPRQWGSLVVCLPVSHGGMPKISHPIFVLYHDQ